MGFLGGKVGNILKGVAKGIGRGAKDVLPIPNLENIADQFKKEKTLDMLEKNPSFSKMSYGVVGNIWDILDDGKQNRSIPEKKVESVSRLISSLAPAAAYIIYGILTGDWNAFF